jgi:hypothetical protein
MLRSILYVSPFKRIISFNSSKFLLVFHPWCVWNPETLSETFREGLRPKIQWSPKMLEAFDIGKLVLCTATATFPVSSPSSNWPLPERRLVSQELLTTSMCSCRGGQHSRLWSHCWMALSLLNKLATKSRSRHSVQVAGLNQSQLAV